MRRFAKNGYEITAGKNEITFADRKTWGLAILMIVLCFSVAALLLLIVLHATGEMEPRSEALGIALPAAAVLLLVVIWIIIPMYRTRRDQPTQEVKDILIVDQPSRVLRDRMGETVAQLADVKARMHIDWWTRGTMRIVVLSWPGGRRTVYRTFGRRRSLDLLKFLKEQGLDAR